MSNNLDGKGNRKLKKLLTKAKRLIKKIIELDLGITNNF